jgi:hypothetical protein
MSQALVEAEADPRDRTRTAYRITGESFTTVQFAIDALMNAPHIARADFTQVRRDRLGYIALGQTFAREQVPA